MKINQIAMFCFAAVLLTSTISAFSIEVTGVESNYQEGQWVSGQIVGSDKMYWASVSLVDKHTGSTVKSFSEVGNAWKFQSLGKTWDFTFLSSDFTPGKYYKIEANADNWWGTKKHASSNTFYYNKKPVLTAIPDTEVIQGQLVSFNTEASDVEGKLSWLLRGDREWNFEVKYDYKNSFTPDAQAVNGTLVDGKVSRSFSNVYNNPGTFILAYKVTDSRGGTDFKTSKVTVKELLSPVINSISVPGSVEEGTTVSLTADVTDPMNGNPNAFTYLWTITKGGTIVHTSTSKTTSYNFASEGGYSVILKVTDTYGKPAEKTAFVLVTKAPEEPNYPPQDLLISESCTYLVCNFEGNAYDPEGDALTYSWNFGDGNTDSGVTAAHTYTQAGSYQVKLTVTDNRNPQVSIFKTINVEAYQEPVPENQPPVASFDYECEELTCVFTDTSTDDGTIVTRSWNFGDGNTDSGATATHTYSEYDAYDVSLTVTDDGGLSDTHTEAVEFNVPSFKADFDSVCYGLSCVFTDKSYDMDGSITGWLWHFGDGKTSSLQNPTHIYSETNIYDVELRVVNSNIQEKSVIKKVTVPTTNNLFPTANAGYSVKAKTGEYVSFIGTGTDSDGRIVLYEWDFDYNASKGFEADWSSTVHGITSHKYARAGTYQARLRVTDNEGAKAYATRIMTITGLEIDDGETSGRKTYDFSLHGIDALRTYEYDDYEDTTTVKLRITNMLGNERNFLIRDKIPTSFAGDIDDFSVSPDYDIIYSRNPEIGWNVTLKGYEVFTITYVFDSYKPFEDMSENFSKPGIIEHFEAHTPSEKTPEETTALSLSGFTGYVLGSFTDSAYGILFLVLIMFVVIVVWKKDYIKEKLKWDEE